MDLNQPRSLRRSPRRGGPGFVSCAIALLLAAALGAAGCKARAGDKCQAGQDTCEDSTTALACESSVLVEARCRGPAGCSRHGTTLSCDDSVSVEGEPCLASDHENLACTADHTQSLLCASGKWSVVERCNGPKGCMVRGGTVTCDVGGAAAGDPCPRPGTFACAADAKSRLACKDGKFVFDRYCRGEAGCRDSDLSCDESVSAPGDPCGVPGMLACDSDRKSALLCRGGHFVAQRSCDRLGCSVGAYRRIDCQ